jgi:HlyD family secretion protein
LILLLGLVVVGCSDAGPRSYQGYAEGEYVRVAAPAAGRLDLLAVQRGAAIKAGTTLFMLERAAEEAARMEAARRVEKAEAQWADLNKGSRPDDLAALAARQAQAEADLDLAAIQLQRQERLVATRTATREGLDQARATYRRQQARVAELAAQLRSARLPARVDQIAAAAAELEAARAALIRAQWQLDQKTVAATVTGVVDDTLYAQGEWVPAGNPVVSILPPENIKVRFFVPEPLLGNLRLRQSVDLACDGCGSPIPAQISFIAAQAEYTPPVIYSRENRTKLVFLVEAIPDPADATRLHPGQPVDVTLR